MENNLREKRIHAYKNSSPTAQALYEDINLGSAYIRIAKSLTLSEESYGKLVDVFGDIILGFYPKTELKRLLMQEVKLTEEIAGEIELELKDFLMKIPDTQTIPVSPNINNSPEVPTPPTVQAVPQPEKIVPSIEHPPVPTPPIREEVVTKTETYTVPKSLTREEVLAALTPTTTRTMAGDIDAVARTSEDSVVHGYDAYQRIKNGL